MVNTTNQQSSKQKQRALAESPTTTQPVTRPTDSIVDPLRSSDSDPMRQHALQDSIVAQINETNTQVSEQGIQHPSSSEAEAILEELRENSPLTDDELDMDALREDELNLTEVNELFEIDDLGTLMNELAELDALDEDSPIVEALIDEELEKAQDGTLNGFANAFVEADDMVEVEQQSQQRPFDDADTRIQVTPMSWVPNRIKTPVGRRATDEPVVDQGLSHIVKQDVSTRDEDNDISVRTRRRFTPEVPTTDAIAAKMGQSHAKQQTNDLLTIVQTYHETMQSNPDLAKTFLLGAIRMMADWVNKEDSREDLDSSETPLDYLSEQLLPKIIKDMKWLEPFFDADVDMMFYRQWHSEALRVRRKSKEKQKSQDTSREEMAEQERQDSLLESIPAGTLLEWSMNNPDQAQELFQDDQHRDAFTTRLMTELFEHPDIQHFLDVAEQGAALFDDQALLTEAESEQLTAIDAATQQMNVQKLEQFSRRNDMDGHAGQIDDSIQAIRGLSPALQRIVRTVLGQYGQVGDALEENVKSRPDSAVQAITQKTPQQVDIQLEQEDIRDEFTPRLVASWPAVKPEEEDEAPDDGPPSDDDSEQPPPDSP